MKRIINKSLYIISYFINKAYEHIDRKRIKEQNFTILCSNCIGGIIYHRLGKRFLSPTINLWMSQPDFLKFVHNLSYYLAKELVFLDDKYEYPIGHLGDIIIHFNHYKTNEEAEACWNRRKQRINFDNLYIIMYDRDGITREDILSLQTVSCRNKIVLSGKLYEDIPYVKTMKNSGRENGAQYMDVDIFGIRTFEKQFDYVKWLNE